MTSDDKQSVCVAIKANLSFNDEATQSAEHLWLVVHQFEDSRAEAQLVNDPLQNDQLKKGDKTWINRDAISDWSVITPTASFGPSQLEELTTSLSELSQGIAT